MAAAVCGIKRSFYEELPAPSPVSKRLRCGSCSSPVWFSAPTLLDQLRCVFPHLELLILEKALEECNNDSDAALKILHELGLGSTEEKSGSAEKSDMNAENDRLKDDESTVAPDNFPPGNNIPVEGEEWVDLFVKEMTAATSMDDAKARAARQLEILEKSINSHGGAEATKIHNENMMMNEQIKGLMKENTILKRAVVIQHQRQKEYDGNNTELQNLKQLMSKYQEQMRTLEMNNYALSMYLKDAQQSGSIPGRFHPDVF